MVSYLEWLFPALAEGGYRVTSPPDGDYNCMAWAAGDTKNWWWPGPSINKQYWPPGVPRHVTLAAFQEAFVSIGYVVCEGEELEAGFEKVALFADPQGEPTHAARQLPDGRWTSKLGKAEDIEHALRDLTGTAYGAVVLILKRPVPATREEPKKRDRDKGSGVES